jgi:hypothetical protein
LGRDGNGEVRLLLLGCGWFDEALQQARVEERARNAKERKELLLALPLVAGFFVGIGLIAGRRLMTGSKSPEAFCCLSTCSSQSTTDRDR